ncbi:MAG: hypothetical protein QF921_17720 [Pseudomonadales bacterium]|nr:hypothetical protein [Pseudomonadales bacterium]MDP6473028.1 hypothetical protein [Pseudomonadales bacterium]MDP6826215.1 hypothetical protein [Pseudomonadales bacterium]MDP6973326.1 hypothetical protein [Pseudomonadales bacterium]
MEQRALVFGATGYQQASEVLIRTITSGYQPEQSSDNGQGLSHSSLIPSAASFI